MTCRTLSIWVATLSLASLATAAVAPFHLTTADLARRDVQVKSITATNVVVFDVATKREQTLAIANVIALSRNIAAPANDGMYLLRLRDGQRIVCTPTAIRNDSIVCATRELGERTIAVADVASIALATLPDATMPAGPQDELRLANGDQLRGIVSAADAKTVACQTPDGQSVAVDWANVRAIRFAETQPATTASGGFIVTLTSGTRVRATKVSADNANATLTVAGNDVSVLLGDVASIEHTEGDAMTLAWVTPASATYVPYFPTNGLATSGYAIDPAAAALFEATTAICVRPKTTLRWPVEATFRRLRVRCAIPAGKAFADVTVRVLDGDRVAFEQKNVKSGATPIEIDVPLTAGGSVSLVADYGEEFDVQDQVVWLDATLLKSAAASPAK